MANYIITDLGLGDSGKGATVDYLCSREQIDLVVRFNGGFQCAHNVVMSDGRHHCFSQYGSGTLRGVHTFIDRHVIVDPLSLQAEKRHLQAIGVPDPIEMIKVHPDCLVSTIFHKILNRVQDKRSGHGSCGVGIGATRTMWSQTGDGLRFSDLSNISVIRRKLDWIRQWCQDQLVDYSNPRSERSDINIDCEGCVVNVFDEARLLYNAAYHVACSDYISHDQSIVFEGAQGYRLDEVYGTIPHTTYSNTRPTYALELCDQFGLDRPKVYGIIRAYETRHGNGPMWAERPTIDGRWRDKSTYIDNSKDHNKGGFAGQFRIGELNIASVKEAYKACQCDAMVINCLDQVDNGTEIRVRQEFKPEIVSYGPTSEDRQRCKVWDQLLA